jgi:hypothetical protein
LAVTNSAERTGSKKQRAVTSIPAGLYRRVQEAAERRGTFQTELLLDAYVNHHEELRRRFGQSGDRAGLPPRPRPRRRHREGVSPCVLFLLPEEREVLDQLAAELGSMSRSELVTHLYELELSGGEEAAP